MKKRILFFAEAATLAHVARPRALASALDPTRFEVHFAHCPRYRELLGNETYVEHEIASISPAQFSSALARGSPLYDFDTLKAYVEEDLQLITSTKPDIVVGDFRLSLAVSAKLAGVPYVTISNAYWSPHYHPRYIVPELPITRIMGPFLAQLAFNVARPAVFAQHCLPMRKLRRYYGLSSLGFDLREVYTHADYTLYADLPGLYSTPDLPENHRFIGPIIWSPGGARPAWWRAIPTDRPVVYVTLGSSGRAELLPDLIKALGSLPITALVSSAGADIAGPIPQNLFLEKYLPGEEAVKLAHLVICNGGSPSTHQALVAGVPVLGLADNLDQYLNMDIYARAGAGRLLRAQSSEMTTIAECIEQMLGDESAREAAENLAQEFAGYESGIEFCKIIDEIIEVRSLNTQGAWP